jgi:MerR family transcriptional regulator, light-induced transcriptional regulator
MRDNQLFSPKQVASALGVSEASIKRWVDKGKIGCVKTTGGHRKIPMYSLVEYIHTNDKTLVNPEILNLPESTGRIKDKINQAALALQKSFIECDEYKIRGVIYDLFLSGYPVEEIFDTLLAPALHQLGCEWERGTIDAFQERRTVQVCIRTLYGFDSFFPQPEEGAPVALLGTLSNDPYTVPVLMVEVCLRSLGWRTEFLGNDLPADSYMKAIEMYKPDLSIVSISFSESDQDLTEALYEIEKIAVSQESGLVIGGRAVPEASVERLQNSLFVYSMQNFKDELPTYLNQLRVLNS